MGRDWPLMDSYRYTLHIHHHKIRVQGHSRSQTLYVCDTAKKTKKNVMDLPLPPAPWSCILLIGFFSRISTHARITLFSFCSISASPRCTAPKSNSDLLSPWTCDGRKFDFDETDLVIFTTSYYTSNISNLPSSSKAIGHVECSKSESHYYLHRASRASTDTDTIHRPSQFHHFHICEKRRAHYIDNANPTEIYNDDMSN